MSNLWLCSSRLPLNSKEEDHHKNFVAPINQLANNSPLVTIVNLDQCLSTKPNWPLTVSRNHSELVEPSNWAISTKLGSNCLHFFPPLTLVGFFFFNHCCAYRRRDLVSARMLKQYITIRDRPRPKRRTKICDILCTLWRQCANYVPNNNKKMLSLLPELY